MVTIMALPPFSATITSFVVLLFLEMITKSTVSWERQHHERLRSVLKERAKDTRGSEHILDASCQGHPTGRFGEYLFGRPKIA